MTHENYRCGDCGGHRFRVDTEGATVLVVCQECLNDSCEMSLMAAFEAIAKEKPCPSSPAS